VQAWKIVFFPRPEDSLRLDEFLSARLDPAYSHRLGHGGRVIIEEGLRNCEESWKVALFVKHNCGIKNLRHMIIGYEGKKIIYLSYCFLCRQGKKKHFEHAGDLSGKKENV